MDGVLYVTFMLAVRFLTDYLEGDRYFRTAYPDHNLDRARNQLALLRDLDNKRLELVRTPSMRPRRSDRATDTVATRDRHVNVTC